MPEPRIEPKQILAVPSSDMLMQHSPEAASVNSGTPSKKKEIVITFAGGYRFRFALEATATRTAYGQVYKNGAAYGIQHNTTSTAPVIFEEDLAGWDPSDLAQLYIWSSPADVVTCYSFSIWGEYRVKPPSIDPGTVNLA